MKCPFLKLGLSTLGFLVTQKLKINLDLLVNFLPALLKDYAMKKYMFLEIMKCIYKAASLKNAGVQTVHSGLLLRFHEEFILRVKNSNF